MKFTKPLTAILLAASLAAPAQAAMPSRHLITGGEKQRIAAENAPDMPARCQTLYSTANGLWFKLAVTSCGRTYQLGDWVVLHYYGKHLRPAAAGPGGYPKCSYPPYHVPASIWRNLNNCR
jgi:hypothetical protein